MHLSTLLPWLNATRERDEALAALAESEAQHRAEFSLRARDLAALDAVTGKLDLIKALLADVEHADTCHLWDRPDSECDCWQRPLWDVLQERGIGELLREQLARTLPSATPDQIEELTAHARRTGADLRRS